MSGALRRRDAVCRRLGGQKVQDAMFPRSRKVPLRFAPEGYTEKNAFRRYMFFDILDTEDTPQGLGQSLAFVGVEGR